MGENNSFFLIAQLLVGFSSSTDMWTASCCNNKSAKVGFLNNLLIKQRGIQFSVSN